MEITQAVLMAVCFTGAGSGLTYLWTTRKVSSITLLVAPFSGGIAELDAIDAQLDHQLQDYQRLYWGMSDAERELCRETHRKQVARRNEFAAKLTKKGISRQISDVEKKVALEAQILSDASFERFREMCAKKNDYNIFLVRSHEKKEDEILDLQPLEKVALKKKSKFNRLVEKISQSKVVADWLIFYGSFIRFNHSILYKCQVNLLCRW